MIGGKPPGAQHANPPPHGGGYDGGSYDDGCSRARERVELPGGVGRAGVFPPPYGGGYDGGGYDDGCSRARERVELPGGVGRACVRRLTAAATATAAVAARVSAWSCPVGSGAFPPPHGGGYDGGGYDGGRSRARERVELPGTVGRVSAASRRRLRRRRLRRRL
jgi:hypothetical protein